MASFFRTKDTNSFYNGYDLNDPYEEIKIRPYQYGAQYKPKPINITKIILDEEKDFTTSNSPLKLYL